MKELPTEEKAKRYDEAIEKAKEINNEHKAQPFDVMLKVFPELQESEDERIRKEITEFLKKASGGFLDTTTQCKTFGKWLAWLEKQGHDGKKWIYEDSYNKEKEELFQDGIDEVLENPQKYGLEKQGDANKEYWRGYREGKKEILDKYSELAKQGEHKPVITIPKFKINFDFKVGQWIVATGKCTYCIIKIEGFNVTLVDIDNNEYVFDVSSLNDAHLWTIQDAQEGDVLCYETKNEFRIFIYKDGHIHYHCCYYNGHLTTVDSFFVLQKHLLSYIHPATKEQRDLLFQKMTEAGYEWDAENLELRKIEQKPQRTVSAEAKEEMYSKPAEWSDDDESNCEDILNHLERARKYFRKDDGITFDEKWFNANIEWLKSIKDRVQPQPKQGWSEEDERIYRGVHNLIYSTQYCDSRKEFSDWLKSLKERYTWRPSDEQMDALRYVLNHYVPNATDTLAWDALQTMELVLEQLKKLREE